MRIGKSKLLVAAWSLCLIMAACVHEPLNPGPGSTEASFKNEILPLLESTCALPACHAGTNPSGSVNLTSYSSVIQTADVKAGDPEGSKLYKALVEDSPSEIMPPGGPLPSAQLELIRRWIEEGAKDN